MDNYFTNTLEWLNRAQKIAGIGIWNQEIATNELWWSDQTYFIFGMKPQSETMNFDKFIEMVRSDYKDYIIAETDKFLKSEISSYNVEYIIKRKDNGEERIIHEEALIERNEDGSPHQIIGIIQDITKRKRAEQALIKKSEELKTANDSKDKFFSIIAHDLKSPFNSLVGFSKILHENFDEYDLNEIKHFIEIIYQQINKTFNLLENLLLWSRTQRNVIEFNSTRINLKLITKQTVELLSLKAESKSINIENQILEDLCIYADKFMIETVFRNLINNSIKFTHKGGNIKINAKIVVTENKQKHVEVSVSDNGVGIPKEKQQSLFDLSNNVSTKGTENETGTGLGLIMCKEFVEKHGGQIWVNSAIGQGSEFVFTVPLLGKN
jgi:PAS domain S-box-containing protein